MSCEVLAVCRLQLCGTRTKYTNISSVITCQVEQAIETGAVRVGERKGTLQLDMQDPRTKLVLQILIGFESASSDVIDRIVIETSQWIELHHVVLTLSNEVERGLHQFTRYTSKLGWMAE